MNQVSGLRVPKERNQVADLELQFLMNHLMLAAFVALHGQLLNFSVHTVDGVSLPGSTDLEVAESEKMYSVILALSYRSIEKNKPKNL